ncbi:DUF600 family protein [Peribacillus simplex]|uniref:DUF600 family protein n=1 Tax=Peribacillus simplex TaxID=1478 RepID=A0A8B5XNT2_9BACI|nr:DUF600 family protein [Peribacillus simplex]
MIIVVGREGCLKINQKVGKYEFKLNSIYQQTAQTINETISEEWSKVLMYGEIADGTGTAFFFYYTPNSEVPIYSHDIPEIYS